MDTGSITGTALMMKSSQTQQTMSMSLMKMESQQQNLLVNMLAQSARQASPPVPQGNGDFNFSIYV